MMAILHRLQCKPRFNHQTDTATNENHHRHGFGGCAVKQFFLLFLSDQQTLVIHSLPLRKGLYGGILPCFECFSTGSYPHLIADERPLRQTPQFRILCL
ncbi:MAG: hypothetical protein RL180_897 [Pseudomonadota bacterium]|jgi:hypothetical protein